MRNLIVSKSDMTGGASRAAHRLHNALISEHIDSKMLVCSKKSHDYRVIGPESTTQKILAKIPAVLDNLPMCLQHTDNPTTHSPAYIGGISAKQINAVDTDVVNLHWICGGTLAIKEIAKITKPVIWTMHDMWAFCGAENYVPDSINARFRSGYKYNNRGPNHTGFDIDRWTWSRKLAHWKKPFEVITPSRWLADCVKASALMHNWPVTIIPNVLDTETFKPHPKGLAREKLGLPRDVKLVLFGAIGGTRDSRKGWDLLQQSLVISSGQNPGLHGVILGQHEPYNFSNIGVPLHWLGHIDSDLTLALVYSAVDVTVLPSRQENLPQIGTEAQACGCPVVAFDTCGLPDVVVHELTGYLATAFSVGDLAHGISWVLNDQERHVILSAKARERSLNIWSQDIIARQYIEIYSRSMESYHN